MGNCCRIYVFNGNSLNVGVVDFFAVLLVFALLGVRDSLLRGRSGVFGSG